MAAGAGLTSNNQRIPLLPFSARVMTKNSGGPFYEGSAQGSPGKVDRVGYDPRTETYHAQHDRTNNGSLSITIVEAIAAVTGAEQGEMEPLHSVLDPDALDTVLSSAEEGDLRVEFRYEERVVTVTESGDVHIR